MTQLTWKKSGLCAIFVGLTILWSARIFAQDLIGTTFFIPKLNSEFKITDFIDSGSHGYVYKAKSLDDTKSVAIKFYKSTSEYSYDSLPAKRESHVFDEKFKILSEHNNQNLVKVYRAVMPEASGQLFTVMDYYPMTALSELRATMIPKSEADVIPTYEKRIHWAYKMLLDVTNATAYLHSKGLIHRDIKPQNILVENNSFVLADVDDIFLHKSNASTQFLPYEILEHEVDVSFLTDLYSVGMSMVQALSRFDHELLRNLPAPESVWHLFSPSELKKHRRLKNLKKYSMDYIAGHPNAKTRHKHTKALFEHLESEVVPKLSPIAKKKFEVIKEVTLTLTRTFIFEQRPALLYLLGNQGLTSESLEEQNLARALNRFLKNKNIAENSCSISLN